MNKYEKIITQRNVTNSLSLFNTISSKSLKLFGNIKRSYERYAKFCLEGLEKEVGVNQNRYSNSVLTN